MINITHYEDTQIYSSLYNEVTIHPAFTVFYANNMQIMDSILILGSIIMFIGIASILFLPRATYILLSTSSVILSVALGIIFTSKIPSLLFMLFAFRGIYLYIKEESFNKKISITGDTIA